MVLYTARAIKINVNGYHTGYDTFQDETGCDGGVTKEQQQRSHDHYVDDDQAVLYMLEGRTMPNALLVLSLNPSSDPTLSLVLH